MVKSYSSWQRGRPHSVCRRVVLSPAPDCPLCPSPPGGTAWQQLSQVPGGWPFHPDLPALKSFLMLLTAAPSEESRLCPRPGALTPEPPHAHSAGCTFCSFLLLQAEFACLPPAPQAVLYKCGTALT